MQVVVFHPRFAGMLTVNFACGSEKKLFDVALRCQSQQLVSRVNVGFNGADRIVGNQFDAYRGGQMKDHVHAVDRFAQRDRVCDGAVANLQATVVFDSGQIVGTAGREIVEHDNHVSLAQKQFR